MHQYIEGENITNMHEVYEELTTVEKPTATNQPQHTKDTADERWQEFHNSIRFDARGSAEICLEKAHIISKE